MATQLCGYEGLYNAATVWFMFVRSTLRPTSGLLLAIVGLYSRSAKQLLKLLRMLSVGLVLMNSAGKIEPKWQPDELEAKNAFVPPRLLVDLISRGLFLCAPDESWQVLYTT